MACGTTILLNFNFQASDSSHPCSPPVSSRTPQGHDTARALSSLHSCHDRISKLRAGHWMHSRAADDCAPDRRYSPNASDSRAVARAPCPRLAKVHLLRAERLYGKYGGVEEGVDIKAVVAVSVCTKLLHHLGKGRA